MRNLGLSIAIVVLVCLYWPICAIAIEPVKISYRVVCANENASKQISSAIAEGLGRFNFEITEDFPVAKLFIYAQQDINDKANPEGWSLAIAHVSNYSTYRVAAKLLGSKNPEVTEVKSTLVNMLNEEGFMTYLNVAHVDELSEPNVTIVVNIIVDNFTKRIL